MAAGCSQAKMDTSPETVYIALKDLGFELSVQDLKSPTEKFMINMITHFFKYLSIDVDAVMKPTFEQIQRLRVTGIENAPIIPIINLCEAFKGVAKEIFIKDFTIFDITSPGAKRTRKLLKMMANFMLYARCAIEKMQPKIDKVLEIGKNISELNKEIENMNDAMNNRAIEMALKEKQNEQVKIEIEKTKKEIANMKSVVQQKKDYAQSTRDRLREKLEKNCQKEKQLKEVEGATKQLQHKLVENPESYQAELEQRKKELREKLEIRDRLQEKVNIHKAEDKLIADCGRIVERMHNKLPRVIELNKDNIKMREKLDEMSQEMAELESSIQYLDLALSMDTQNVAQDDITKWETKRREQKERNKLKIIEVETQIEKFEAMINDLIDQETNPDIENYDLISKIAHVEGDNKMFLADCQRRANEMIRKMHERHRKGREAVTKALKSASGLKNKKDDEISTETEKKN